MKATLPLRKLAALVAFALVLGSSGTALADTTTDTQTQINAMQQQLDAMKAQLDQLKAQQAAAAAQKAAAPKAPEAAAGTPVTLEPGNNVTFMIGKNPVQVYGNLDLSFDDTTKGLKSSYPNPGGTPFAPVGNYGWMTGISSNLSYFGARGSYKLGPQSHLLWQLETQLDVSATSGTPNTNSNNDAVVKGGLTSRNSFIGIGTDAGNFKIGKTDAPYKNSTSRMNPFNATIGDYAIVMGNTGGDNRVEFGTRLDHALWYESPTRYALQFNALVSPGQNRAYDDSNIPAGEPSCAGGNLPGSGATPPACNDGAWGTVYSADLQWQPRHSPLYLTAAWELHKQVNRSSDIAVVDAPSAALAAQDVADEQAMKYGAQWQMSRASAFSLVYEQFWRYVPADLQYQNERQRDGWYSSFTTLLSPKDQIALEWAHAGQTPGDPGQHNTPGGPNQANQANVYAFLYRHQIDRHVSWYTDWALTANQFAAHYDLGAGGRGLTTDCHDATQLTAFDPTVPAPGLPVSGTGPHCYAGGQLQGFSTGLKVTF